MSDDKRIHVNHNVEVYIKNTKYRDENLLMGLKYLEYVHQHTLVFDDFLELGIGFGQLIESLSRFYSHVVILDGDERLIDRSKKRFLDVQFVHTYYEEFETQDKYHNIGMGFALDLVNDPVELLKKYSGYLDKDGRIFVSIENAASLHRLIAYNAGLISDIREMSAHNMAFSHKCYKTYEDWLEVFRESGLKLVTTYGLFLKPFSTDQLRQLNLDNKILQSLANTARDFPETSNACFFVLQR